MNKFILKFLWLDKTLAVALDQKVSDRFTPLTEFFFWPQTDAWEEMKLFFEANDWIDQDNSIILLNQITEVINEWQEKNDSTITDISLLRKKYSDCVFVNFN
jgi:30S ribosomal protein 3